MSCLYGARAAIPTANPHILYHFHPLFLRSPSDSLGAQAQSPSKNANKFASQRSAQSSSLGERKDKRWQRYIPCGRQGRIAFARALAWDVGAYDVLPCANSGKLGSLAISVMGMAPNSRTKPNRTQNVNNKIRQTNS